MTLDVTVALIADPVAPFRTMVSEDELTRPYSERRKARLEAAEEESFASVLERAAAVMGITPPAGHYAPGFSAFHNRVAFYKPEDEEAAPIRSFGRLFWYELILVGSDGRAIFGVSDKRAVTYGDLICAADAGTIEGDPLRPYLIVEPGWGDAPPPDWPTVLEALRVLREVLEVVATTGGVLAFGKLVLDAVRDRAGRGGAAIEAHREWAQRGTRPYQFAGLIGMKDWTPAELATLLGCTEDEAEAILWTLGFAFDDDAQRWTASGDEAAKLIAKIHAEVGFASHRGGDWQPLFRRRLIKLLEDGDAPDYAAELEPDAPTVAISIGDRIGWTVDSWITRLRNRR